MKKIAICGPACAGKTTVCNMLFDGYTLKFAQPHYDVLNVLGVPKHRLFMQEFSDLVKKHFGEDIFVKIFERRAEELESKGNIHLLICDDIRYLLEINSCLENNWKLVYVYADPQIRRERSDALGLTWSPNHSSEQIDNYRAFCHHDIINNTTLEKLSKEVEVIKRKICI